MKEILLDALGYFLLFALVFSMAATVDINCFAAQLKNSKAILLGMALQFILMPFLGFLVVEMLDLDKAVGVTLLVITSSPGGSYSNWWCSIFNADLALSITMTAVSTLMSIVMLPLSLLTYANFVFDDEVVKSLDWPSLFKSIFVVISAVLLGLVCSARVRNFTFNKMANRVGNFSGLALILFSVVMSRGASANDVETDIESIEGKGWKFYVGVAAPVVVSLALANVIVTLLQMKKPERVTIAIECCYQNTGIATSVALTMFDGNDTGDAMAVTVYYGIVEAVCIIIYCIGAWKAGWTKAPPTDSFWGIIAKSYEVSMAENEAAIEVVMQGQTVPQKARIEMEKCVDSSVEEYQPMEDALHVT
mmetsp:Transcript_40026/g.93963  ORF Transcript_40026/g.93963 Transcript_40026/m.93963 type:complete len:363 (-) Transcript_40026:224-1312(-)